MFIDFKQRPSTDPRGRPHSRRILIIAVMENSEAPGTATDKKLSVRDGNY